MKVLQNSKKFEIVSKLEGFYNMTVQLPPGLQCGHCVLQVRCSVSPLCNPGYCSGPTHAATAGVSAARAGAGWAAGLR